MMNRLSAPDVDISIGGYSDEWTEPELMCATPTCAYHEETMYADTDPYAATAYVAHVTERRGMGSSSEVQWPEDVSARLVHKCDRAPRDTTCSEIRYCTEFGKPKGGKWHKVGRFPNQIFCRTASMVDAQLSAYIQRLIHSGGVQKVLA